MKKFICIVLVVIVSATYAKSQTKVVSGTVTAFKDLCLKNIQVSTKNTKASVSTDSMGRYTIVCAKKDRLTFKGYGFQQVMRKTNNKDVINVKMLFKEGVNNEEIAVGYGHISKENLTFAINNLSEYNNDFVNYPDVFSIMEGKFAGATIIEVNGQKKVQVRGIGSLTGDNYAIYVVDGTEQTDISYLTPSIIKSITLLKDGNSIYGARGGNGAVIITTLSK